jgi:ribosomal protein S18 acetylase RimI-like enzyme
LSNKYEILPLKTVEYQPASQNSIHEILQLMEDFYAMDGYAFDKKTMQSSLVTFISNNNLGYVWLIKVEMKTVGYVCLTMGFSFEYGGIVAVLDELYLKPQFRGKGYGKTTLDFLKLHAKEKGIAAIHMEVESHNTSALKLYTLNGYQTKGRRLYTKIIT